MLSIIQGIIGNKQHKSYTFMTLRYQISGQKNIFNVKNCQEWLHGGNTKKHGNKREQNSNPLQHNDTLSQLTVNCQLPGPSTYLNVHNYSKNMNRNKLNKLLTCLPLSSHSTPPLSSQILTNVSRVRMIVPQPIPCVLTPPAALLVRVTLVTLVMELRAQVSEYTM